MPDRAGGPVGYKYAMIALIQRVEHATVEVDGQIVGEIGTGLLALVGVRPDDDAASGTRLLQRLLTYRVFGDDAGRMNRSLVDTGGGLLLVPQFTLAADTRRGTRPGFSTAAPPPGRGAVRRPRRRRPRPPPARRHGPFRGPHASLAAERRPGDLLARVLSATAVPRPQPSHRRLARPCRRKPPSKQRDPYPAM